MNPLLTRRATIFVVAALTLWRAYLAATLQLHPDEAYYWLWSDRLAASYFDHAPLVGYLIAITTVFSDAEFWVRLSGVLMMPVLSALLWRMARQMYDSVPVAAAAVMLFNAAPLTLLGLLVVSPDVPVVFFWSLGVWLLWELARTGRAGLWYALGAVYGLALLSKYTGVLFAPCVLLFLLISDERRWLRTPHPYLGVLLGLLLFLPVVYWNSQHDWLSFRFQLGHGLGESAGPWSQIGTYLAGQALFFGLFAWMMGVWGSGAALLRRDKASLLLLSMSVPVIVFFGITSYRSVAGPNWPAFAYFGFSLLAASVLRARSWQRLAAWVAALFTGLALSLVLTVHARYTVLPDSLMSEAAREADATNWFHGWREYGQHLQAQERPALILAASHQLAAEIIYYTGGKLPVQVDLQARPSQFSLWPMPAVPGRQGIYAWVDDGAGGDYAPYFDEVRRESTFRVYRAGHLMRTYRAVEGTMK